MILGGDPKIMADPQGRRWNEMVHSGKGAEAAIEIIVSFGKGTISKAIMPLPGTPAYRGAWQETIAAAEAYNDPGRFTAIIGYEYTTRGGFNMHRNVLFRGDAGEANQTVPYSQYDSQNPEDLWRHLDGFQKETGAQVLAIPHNGNLSNGRMFSLQTFDGSRYDRELAELRASLEPLYEVTQIKGDGETHPSLSPSDEFADYETWDRSNLNGTEAKTPDMIQYEYAREALKNGLVLGERLGVNPFKFGMVGSTDSHTSMSGAEEENFFGKHSGVEPNEHRWEHVVIEAPNPEFTVYGWQQMAGGWAAVWATETTREALFEALMR
jgi:hypothetical protein